MLSPSLLSPFTPEPVKQVRELMVTKQWDEQRVKVVLLHPCTTRILKKKLQSDSTVDVPEDCALPVHRAFRVGGLRSALGAL